MRYTPIPVQFNHSNCQTSFSKLFDLILIAAQFRHRFILAVKIELFQFDNNMCSISIFDAIFPWQILIAQPLKLHQLTVFYSKPRLQYLFKRDAKDFKILNLPRQSARREKKKEKRA